MGPVAWVPTADAATTARAALTDSSLIGGSQRAVVTGRVPGGRRTVLLQRLDGSWRTVGRTTSNRRGVFTVTDRVARTGVFRVSAPRTGRASTSTSRTMRAVPADGLRPGETLRPGSSITSPSGTRRLVMQRDGNLVWYAGQQSTWASGTSVAGSSATMQRDGNLVVRSASGAAQWSTTTDGFSGVDLRAQDDGNLVLYRGHRPLWASRDGVLYDELRGGAGLGPGEKLVSRDHTWSMVVQADGNVVVYRSGGAARWASVTNGSPTRLEMQADGNLVVYRDGGKAVWDTRTGGLPGGLVRMQNDGNLVLYTGGRAMWSSDSGTLFNTLQPGQVLGSGQTLWSANRVYRLVMQGDGNLVLYRGGSALWATKTSRSGSYAQMQTDGNLVVYAPGGTPAIWDSKTAGSSGARLVVQDDANVVLYVGARPVWDRHQGRLGGSTPSTGDATARGQSWVDARVGYDQTKYFTNGYGTYRTDCSGFVSMMWALGSSFNTRTLTQVAHRIGKDDLRTGDVMLAPASHVLLFDRWADSSRTSYWAYEQTPPRAVYRKVPYPYFGGSQYGDFSPYRKN